MSEADQIETQAETIKALWCERARLKRRCETQQSVIDWQARRIEDLEADATPQAQADKLFRGAMYGKS